MPISTNNNDVTTFVSPFEDQETYYGRILHIIDIGLQSGGEYLGEKKPDCEQIIITVEFPDIKTDKDEPAWLSLFFKLPQRWDNGNFRGLHKKSNTYKLLNLLVPELLWSKDPKGSYSNFGFNFSWDALINQPISCTVAVNEEGNSKIVSFDKVPKKYLSDVPELINKPVVLDMGSPNITDWESIPNWIKKIILRSLDPTVVKAATNLTSMEATPPFEEQESTEY